MLAGFNVTGSSDPAPIRTGRADNKLTYTDATSAWKQSPCVIGSRLPFNPLFTMYGQADERNNAFKLGQQSITVA
jgi:hypothetical protein